MKKIVKWTVIALLSLAIGLCGIVFVARYLFLGRLFPPTTADFVTIAQANQHIVQAIYDYKAEHGLWPKDLDDLIPHYLTARPSNPMSSFDNEILYIHAGVPHTYVCYCFQQGSEGWSAKGDFGTGSLALPKGATTRPVLTGDELIHARLSEYDRRIAVDLRGSTAEVHRDYTEKITYLVSVGRKSDAIGTSREAAKAFPDWWRPPMTLAMLADSKALEQPEAALQIWVKEHPTFIHFWYLSHFYSEQGHHDMAVAALRQAVKYSLADNDDDSIWVPDAFAFNASQYACTQRQPELVLEITRLWEQPRGVYNYHNDNLHAFKAAAELMLGRFDEAKADLDRVVNAGKTQGLWAGNLDQLDRAVTAKDKTFTYQAGKQCDDWCLFPPPE